MEKLLQQRTPVDVALWGGAIFIILAGVIWMLRHEKRSFDMRGKGRSWLWMRVLSLPMLGLTGLAIVLPARSISGMEALGVFYIALVTVGPLTWFGLHALAGALLSPRLTRSESMGMAFMGIAVLIVPALAINVLQDPLHSASRLVQRGVLATADAVPLAHEPGALQRFRLGDAGELHAQSLRAPPGVRVERVEAQAGGQWFDTKSSTHTYYCRTGEDLHLAWPAGSPPPPLRLYWRVDGGTLRQAEFRVPASGFEQPQARDFNIGWRDDGIDLPVPLSRWTVQFGWMRGAAEPRYRSLDMLQPGENFENNCVAAGYRRVAWREEGPVAAVLIIYHRTPPAAPLRHEIRRP